jgi:hypothetical protein
MTEPTLKPCPRCGGPGEIREDYDAQAWSGRYYARCTGNGCGLLSPHFETVGITAAWWNKRPAEQAQRCQSVSSQGYRCQVSQFHLGPHQNGGCQWWDVDAKSQPEPTRNATDEPEKATLKAVVNTCLDRIEAAEAKQHQCPYEGCMWTSPTATWADEPKCGDYGWLCDRCKEDRADRRTRALVYGLALVRSGRGDGNLPGCAEAEFILKQEGLL